MAALQDDDLGVLVEPAGPCGHGRSGGNATYDNNSHGVLLVFRVVAERHHLHDREVEAEELEELPDQGFAASQRGPGRQGCVLEVNGRAASQVFTARRCKVFLSHGNHSGIRNHRGRALAL